MILLQLENQIEHNKHLALHDELTGLPNRRLFEDRLIGALERARRSGMQTALLLVDLDHFKRVNDTVGHHIGDLLLKRVGEIFNARVRRSDTVARTGGDEFSIILESPTSREIAGLVGASLTQLLEEPFEFEGHSVQIGGSVGIAVFPEDANDAASLRIAADLRMYGDKNSGRAPSPNSPPARALMSASTHPPIHKAKRQLNKTTPPKCRNFGLHSRRSDSFRDRLNRKAQTSTNPSQPGAKVGLPHPPGSPRTGLRSRGGPARRLCSCRQGGIARSRMCCFVTGHDFSRATRTTKRSGFSVCVRTHLGMYFALKTGGSSSLKAAE